MPSIYEWLLHFYLQLNFSFELLVHIFNTLLNILSRCISLSKGREVVMGILQNVVVLVYKGLLSIHIAV